MFIQLDPVTMRHRTFDEVIWDACSVLYRQGIDTFIHDTEPRTVSVAGLSGKQVPVIDYAKSGVRFSALSDKKMPGYPG